ncbi:MAG: M1 family metallopeptidase [Saprospiraceae bacterium]|nr:M1 family metallopeptidase [Saprospiraceae bacterium]
MTKTNYFLLLLITSLLFACKTNQTIVNAPIIEEDILDTMVVSAPAIDPEVEESYELDVYRASATRELDILHTKLEIAFDWEKQHVLGKAYLTFKPYFYATQYAVLDAKVFDIHSITMNGKTLAYEYDEQKLKIDLAKVYTRNDTIDIIIDYTAKPNEGPSGGSSAILSDKGLFFINPLGEGSKPQQIWTQGETENSSRWFPTVDKPNERCSQEIYVTVEGRFQTLSNGKLISSKDNENGTRTDYWKQDKPHAPYLFMLGVGEYAVVKDKWKSIPLMYYVEPAFEKDAKKIFNHTPEMLQFFSDKLQYPYPWDKYAQIICRDYVSGAMENTGAVVFGEFAQKSSRELLDSNNDDIVAHELFHHWFGDLVTCESWSNLTLNEGFATYSEYMWREYKYGKANAERKRLQDLNGYLMSAGQQGYHDLIDFEYGNRENMFDGHSYNKGGLIVHMLRQYVGDDAFFSALNKYLTSHEYTDVEAHELRLAFEDTTGEDLNWFFNQWFYDKGHPILEIEYIKDTTDKVVYIDMAQVQDPDDFPAIFQFEVHPRLYYPSGKVETYDFFINEREQSLTIEVLGDEMPSAVVFDGTHDLLAVIKEERSDEEHFNLFKYSDEYEDKYLALKAMKNNDQYKAAFALALKDDSKEIRSLGIGNADKEMHGKTLEKIALNDPSSANRAKALKKIKDVSIARKLITTDSSYQVIGIALEIINRNDKAEGLEIANKLTQEYYKPLISKIASIYAGTKEEKYLSFFEDNLSEVGLFDFFSFMQQYEKVAMAASKESMLRTAKVLQSIAQEKSSNYFKKYATTNCIKKMLQKLEKASDENDVEHTRIVSEMTEIMYDIVGNSTDKRLKSAFSEFTTP